MEFSRFDYIDIDDEMNKGLFYTASDMPEDIAIWRVELLGDFMITNAEGESFICNGTKLSGDMEIIADNVICKGMDTPAEMVIFVAGSDSFCYENLSENAGINFTIWNEKGHAAIEGVNIDVVQIDEANRMLLDGTEMEYEILYEDKGTEEAVIVTRNEQE